MEIEKQALEGEEFTKYANNMPKLWKERATGYHVTRIDYNTWVFEVITRNHGLKGGNKHVVLLQDRTCTCNKWQTYQVPCFHILACCASVVLQYTRFVSEWYKLENVKKVYLGKFHPIHDKKAWPLLGEFPRVVANEDIPKKPGRRKLTRYKSEMDYQEKGKETTSSAS
ncbi:uncharacterized protein LOC141679975 [Apium graveolens]|uniref:uncharacterized protein LOC141679975 n=1 Tax=Apium graveolens TaxID=4045 RepID=UPI003D79D0AD